MYPETQTFWLDPTNMEARGLRRYSHRTGDSQDCEGRYHQTLVYIERGPALTDETGHYSSPPEADRSDPRWPTTCSRCNYRFPEADVWQSWSERIYERATDGQQFVLHPSAGADVLDAPSAPPGATWNADWIPWAKSDDGICLMVRLPNNHDWMVDSEASNCTRKGEPHACWVRHGRPQEAQVTVDKNGDTCAAGAGSIAVPGYHGFLIRGVLTAG